MTKNQINYIDLIKTLKLEKKSNLLICIPTFNSFEVTSETIRSFLSQKNVEFDIMVTGPSGDIEKLSQLFPQINYCLTKDNYGSSGNQLINIDVSTKYSYEFVMLSDNDAVLLEEDGLYKLKEKLVKSDLLVTYPNNFKYIKISNENFCTLHCCIYRTEVFKLLKPAFIFNYFLLFDDVALNYRLRNFFDKIQGTDCNYYHPFKISSFFSYSSIFFYVRSYLIILLFEDLSLKHKFHILKNYFPLFWFARLFFRIDFKILYIFFVCLKQVILKKYSLIKLPKDTIVYEEVINPHNKDIYKFYSLVYNNIYDSKFIFAKDMLGNCKYYRLTQKDC